MNRWRWSLIVGGFLFCVASATAQPKVEKGVIDLRGWDFESDGTVKLDGTWNFYWQEFLTPRQLTVPANDFFEFPSIWNDKFSERQELNGQGFATYSTLVLCDSTLSMLSMELPDFYSSYELWVNGESLASNGEVGTSRKESLPQWLPKTIVFPGRDTLQLVLQVANFHHKKGGCNDHIYLGLPDQLYHKREQAVITNIILFGGLGLIGCFFVVLFSFFKNERAALYFAAICITWAFRSVFTNLYLFINWYPSLDWEFAVKVEYLSLYLTMMWSVLFVGRLFPNDMNAIAKYVLLIVNFIFILFTIASPAFTYTNLLPAYIIVAWVILGYIAFVVIKAIIYERVGAWFSAGSIFLGVLMFSYDMLTYQGVWNFSPLLFNLGYMTIFLLNATAFAYQLSRSINPKQTLEFGLTLK